MAELDKTISVIESWLKQPVLTLPPINELYDALELLKEYKHQDGCPCTHCMEWECDEVCEEYKKWKDS